jgi:hypothetical protein
MPVVTRSQKNKPWDKEDISKLKIKFTSFTPLVTYYEYFDKCISCQRKETRWEILSVVVPPIFDKLIAYVTGRNLKNEDVEDAINIGYILSNMKEKEYFESFVNNCPGPLKEYIIDCL